MFGFLCVLLRPMLFNRHAYNSNAGKGSMVKLGRLCWRAVRTTCSDVFPTGYDLLQSPRLANDKLDCQSICIPLGSISNIVR